jgi:predicted unusual protein kinase regulating ubiquinone biosynthesis (AarF/ABC1/UbiB family)
MEGIAETVHPEIDLLETARPHLISIYLRRTLDPTPHAKSIVNYLNEYRVLLRHLPSEIQSLVRKANAGELQLKLDQPDTLTAAKMSSKAINRIAAVGLMATIMLSSALLSFVTGETEFAGFSLVKIGAAVGFTVSIMMSSFLWFKLMRSPGL